MKIGTWGLALSLAMTGVATAQPAPPQPQPPPVASPRDPTGPPLVVGPETPPAPEAAPVPPPVHQEPANTGRPSELAFGIGIGYSLPTSLQTPNTTSVRLRLPTGLTFEPQLVFATTSTDIDTGTTRTNKQNEVTLGSLVRYPLLVHTKVDFELVGSASISHTTNDPDGDSNTTTITTVAVGYGVALAYWFTPHWNLSLTASNPLVSYSRTRTEMTGDTVMVNKTTTIGVVFDPQVALMIHLYN
jgi:hypothetical protein